MVKAGDASGASATNGDSQVEAKALERLNAATGRQFSSLAEAEKHLQGLNRLVGDQTLAEQREKAQIADALVERYAQEQGISLQQAREQIQGLVRPSRPAGGQARSETKDPAIEQRLERLERFEFLEQNPNARPYMDKVTDYSKATGKSLSESYEFLYGDVVKQANTNAQADTIRDEKRQATATVSAAPGIAQAPDPEKALKDRYIKSGGKDESAARELMKERWNRSLAARQNKS